MTRHDRRRRAFTLIEVTTVCAVLAVLTALLLQVQLLCLTHLDAQRDRLLRRRDAESALTRLKRDVRAAGAVEVTADGSELRVTSGARSTVWRLDGEEHRLLRQVGAGREAPCMEWAVDGGFRLVSTRAAAPVVAVRLRFAPVNEHGAPLVIETAVAPRRPGGGSIP